jgi:hypothetical protein
MRENAFTMIPRIPIPREIPRGTRYTGNRPLMIWDAISNTPVKSRLKDNIRYLLSKSLYSLPGHPPQQSQEENVKGYYDRKEHN